MGGYASKLFSHHGDFDGKSKLSTQVTLGNLEKHQCTPIMTRRSTTADPRSATMGITRTPIEVAATPTGVARRAATAIPKYLQVKQYLETDIDAVMPTMTPEHRIPDPRSPNIAYDRTPIVAQSAPHYVSPLVHVNEAPKMNTPDCPGLDPRSPATTFDRTPILKPKSPEHIDPSSQQNPAKCDSESTHLQMSYCETTSDYCIPEIQALPEIMTSKPSNLEKRLAECDESNDSNLDCSSSSESSSEESESEGQITVIPNLNALKIMADPEEEKEEEIRGANGAIRVWRDSVSPQPVEVVKAQPFINSEEIIIEFDDDQSIVKPRKPETATVKTDNKDSIPTPKPRKVQQLSKDSKPIFEDAKEFVGDGMGLDVQQNRTPLGNRSNNHKLSIPSKSPQQLLRNKGLSTKSKQQENTPPRIKHYKSKAKANGTQWDLDRTVII